MTNKTPEAIRRDIWRMERKMLNRTKQSGLPVGQREQTITRIEK